MGIFVWNSGDQMDKFEKELSKWFKEVYREHDQVQKKCDQWMLEKNRELTQLEKKANTFEKEMEKSVSNLEKWLQKQQVKWKEWFSYFD